MLAVDCLLPGFYEGPLLRKLPLRLIKSAAIDDPHRALDGIVSSTESASLIIAFALHRLP